MKNDFEGLFNSIKNLKESISRYIEMAESERAFYKEAYQKYMRGFYEGKSNGYQHIESLLEDIINQFKEEEE